MAWTYLSAGSGSNATGSALTVTVQNTGDCLIAVVSYSNTGTMTFSDNNGGNWTTDLTIHDTVDGESLAIGSAPNHSSGSTQVTATPSVGGNHALAVLDYSGIATSSPADVSAGTFNFGNTGGLPSSGATGATGAANELVLAGIYDSSGGGQTFGAGSGFTSRQNPSIGFMVEDKDSGSAGSTPSGDFTSDKAFFYWIAGVVVYKISGGGGGFTAKERRTLGPRVGSRSSQHWG